jgi:hypothetical protein
MQCEMIVTKAYYSSYNERVQLWLIIIILQNCMDLLKVVPGSYSETCPTSSHDGNQVVNIKYEVTDVQEEEEDPLLITSSGIRDEHTVSSISMCSHETTPFS